MSDIGNLKEYLKTGNSEGLTSLIYKEINPEEAIRIACNDVTDNFTYSQLLLLVELSGIRKINGKPINESSKDELCEAISRDLFETKKSRLGINSKVENLAILKCILGRFDGKYIATGMLGHGTFGEIYELCDDNDCSYALKIVLFSERDGYEDTTEEGFNDEIKYSIKAGEVGVGPIVHAHGTCQIDEDNDTYIVGYILMDKLNATEFYKIIKKNDNFSLYLEYIFDSMYTLYINGIHHNDLRNLRNIMINEKFDRVYLIDYGQGSSTEYAKNNFVKEVNFIYDIYALISAIAELATSLYSKKFVEGGGASSSSDKRLEYKDPQRGSYSKNIQSVEELALPQGIAWIPTVLRRRRTDSKIKNDQLSRVVKIKVKEDELISEYKEILVRWLQDKLTSLNVSTVQELDDAIKIY